ncbi:MAG: LysE family translocator [Rhizobiales bacterium]|nr:LysE family translocator [Hyphomicrobiales bacterium]
MTFDQIAAFVIFAAVAAGTPGPSNVMLAAVGASVGCLRGLPCLFGVAAGMGALIFVSAFGLGGALMSLPAAVPVMKAAGTLFLIYLAWKIATSSGLPQEAGDGAVGFWAAAGFQWINPKAWMAGIGAAAASLGAAHESVLRDSMLLGATFAATAFIVCIPWLGFGSLIRRALVDPQRRRAFNMIMGGLLAASATMFWL